MFINVFKRKKYSALEYETEIANAIINHNIAHKPSKYLEIIIIPKN